jgi:hypothetical protein
MATTRRAVLGGDVVTVRFNTSIWCIVSDGSFNSLLVTWQSNVCAREEYTAANYSVEVTGFWDTL